MRRSLISNEGDVEGKDIICHMFDILSMDLGFKSPTGNIISNEPNGRWRVPLDKLDSFFTYVDTSKFHTFRQVPYGNNDMFVCDIVLSQQYTEIISFNNTIKYIIDQCNRGIRHYLRPEYETLEIQCIVLTNRTNSHIQLRYIDLFLNKKQSARLHTFIRSNIRETPDGMTVKNYETDTSIYRFGRPINRLEAQYLYSDGELTHLSDVLWLKVKDLQSNYLNLKLDTMTKILQIWGVNRYSNYLFKDLPKKMGSPNASSDEETSDPPEMIPE